MVQKVNKSPWIELIVRTVDCVQSSLYKVVFVVGKVRNIDVRVLEPETRFENSKINVVEKKKVIIELDSRKKKNHSYNSSNISNVICFVALTMCK